MQARLCDIRSIAQSHITTVKTGSGIDARGRYLVSNGSLRGYRAIVAELDFNPGQPVVLDAGMRAALNVSEGSRIRLIAL